MSPTGVTDQHAFNQQTLVSVIRKHQCVLIIQRGLTRNSGTGRERLIRSHSSARFCFELSGNSN